MSKDSFSHNVMFIFVDHISGLMDRFKRSLRFHHIEFDKEAIADG